MPTTDMPARPARTTRVPDVFVGQGAVAQNGGSLPLYRCNTCLAEVVWATSKRTGRKYLANVSRGHLDQRYYIGANVHRCADRLAAIAESEAHADKVALDRRLTAVVSGAMEARRNGWITQPECAAYMLAAANEHEALAR